MVWRACGHHIVLYDWLATLEAAFCCQGFCLPPTLEVVLYRIASFVSSYPPGVGVAPQQQLERLSKVGAPLHSEKVAEASWQSAWEEVCDDFGNALSTGNVDSAWTLLSNCAESLLLARGKTGRAMRQGPQQIASPPSSKSAFFANSERAQAQTLRTKSGGVPKGPVARVGEEVGS